MLSAYIAETAGKIRRRKERKRDCRIDILRAFGIFCIVYAHNMDHGFRLSNWLTVSSVYVIQLFVFCAGYFYRDSDLHFGRFLLKKAKEYLLPYYVWNLIYGVLSSILRGMGVIGYGEKISLYTMLVQPWTDGAQFYFNYASWFLLSLFLVVLATDLLRRLIRRFREMDRKADYILLAVLFLLSLGAMILLGEEQYHYGLKAAVLRPIVLLPYYQLGYVYHRYWAQEGNVKRKLVWVLVLLLAQIALNKLCGPLGTKMVYGHFIGNPAVLILAALTAVLLSASIAGVLEKYVSSWRVLSTVSQNTMSIMLHHMFVMFLIEAVLWILGVPGFDAEQFHSSIWYDYTFGMSREWFILIYVALGLAVPVFCHCLYEKVILKLSAKEKV